MSSNHKKRKHGELTEREKIHQQVGFTPWTLQDIHDKLLQLITKVPSVPDFTEEKEAPPNDNDETLIHASLACDYSKPKVRHFCQSLQTILEEYHLLIAAVSAATYQWGTDRSGAADQNLNVLSAELVRSQENINNRVSNRLNEVLYPVSTILTRRTVTTHHDDNQTNGNNGGGGGGEVKTNHFVKVYEDVDYVNLCYNVVGRNADNLRHLLIANIDKCTRAIHDYLKEEQQNESGSNRRNLY